MIMATVIGNLGRDGELKTTPNGKSVLNISIAAKGKVKDETIWVRGAVWGQRAEGIKPYLVKGTKVIAFGKLTSHEHEGKMYLELDIQEIDFSAPRDGRPAVTGAKPQGAGDLPF